MSKKTVAELRQDVEDAGRCVRADDPVFDMEGTWEEVVAAQGYYPTRLEYFAGKAFQGLIAGAPSKSHKHLPEMAVALAKALEDAVDSAQDD